MLSTGMDDGDKGKDLHISEENILRVTLGLRDGNNKKNK